MQVSCISESAGQSSGVRGSPLLRFILLAIALMATAAGLARVTASRSITGSPVPGKVAAKFSSGTDSVPFRLLLSAPATEVTLNTGNEVRPSLDGPGISGVLEIDPANPQVAIVIRWKKPAEQGEHRFAKLTLEAPGKDTFHHVFESDGDIDDLLELPLPAKK